MCDIPQGNSDICITRIKAEHDYKLNSVNISNVKKFYQASLWDVSVEEVLLLINWKERKAQQLIGMHVSKITGL